MSSNKYSKLASDEGDLYAKFNTISFSLTNDPQENNAYKQVIEYVGEKKVSKIVSDANLYTTDNYNLIKEAFYDKYFGRICFVWGIFIVALILLMCQIFVPFGNILTISLTSAIIGICVISGAGFYSYRNHIISGYEDIREQKNYDT